jgi:hypothetical protein
MSNPIKMAIMAMTTNSSMSVKAFRLLVWIMVDPPRMMEEQWQ